MSGRVCLCGHNEGLDHDECGCKQFVARDVKALKSGTPEHTIAIQQLALIEASERGDDASKEPALKVLNFTHAFCFGEGVPLPSLAAIEAVEKVLSEHGATRDNGYTRGSVLTTAAKKVQDALGCDLDTALRLLADYKYKPLNEAVEHAIEQGQSR